MKKYIFLFLSLLIFGFSKAATTDTTGLGKCIYDLDLALLQKDTVALHRLLHTDVMYGHSNGWIEKKAEVINNLYNGTLHYESIKPTTTPIVVVEHNVAAVRQTADIIVSLNDKKITLTLHVLQVWIKTHDSWQLFSRQSTKL
jgi:hypothetical protein